MCRVGSEELQQLLCSSCPLPPPVLQQGISPRCPSTPQLGIEGANDPFSSSYKTKWKGAEIAEAALPPSCQMSVRSL